MSEVVHVALGKFVAQDGDQLGLQRFVHQDVGILGRIHHAGGFGGVAADDNGPAFVIKAVAHRRLHRGMVHPKSRHLQAFAFQYHHGVTVAHGRQGKRHGFAATAAGGHDFVGVVAHAVAVVERIGGSQPIDHLIHARWPINGQGCRGRGKAPVLQHEWAHAINMVRVEMRQKQGLRLVCRDAHVAQIARCAFARIDDKNSVPGNHHRAGARTRGVREGRTGAAKRQMQAVGQFRNNVAPNIGVGHPLQQYSADVSAKSQRQYGEQDDQSQQAHGHAFEGLHHCAL